MGGAQHQLIIELKIAIVLSIFCIAATKVYLKTK